MAEYPFHARYWIVIAIIYIIDVRIRQNINDIYNKIPEAEASGIAF